jgi:hypothetical protein
VVRALVTAITDDSAMASFYFYKMTTDNGGAPCSYKEVLTLAICKPMIRAAANEGDVLFGFAANDIDPSNGLIYVAEVRKKLRNGEYYRDPIYRERPDCIYEATQGGYGIRKNRKFHGTMTELTHDLGEDPIFARANVLLSKHFRYFGADRILVDESQYPALRERLRALCQGHRINHSPAVREDLEKLKKWVFEQPGPPVRGSPAHPTRRQCDRDDNGETC